MAKETLLEIVQEILSDSDGDNVNSISDTVESDQCARIVRSIFNDIVDIHDVEYHEQIKQLNATSTSTPNVMTRPEGFHTFEWIKYDKRTTAGGDPRYETVHYKPPVDFVNLCQNRTESDSDVTAVTLDSGFQLLVKNDQAPTFYTFLQGYDDIIFDSYDSALDANLQASKSLAFGVIKPTLSLTDTSVPDLPKHLFHLLKNQSRAYFFDIYKGGTTREVDRRHRQSVSRAKRHRHMSKEVGENTGPDYGRK